MGFYMCPTKYQLVPTGKKMNDVAIIFRTTMYACIHRAKQYLENRHIPCYIQNADTADYSGIGQLGSGINPAIGEYTLCVLREEADRASKLLRRLLPRYDTHIKKIT
jgi:hypothetical protein